MKTIKLSEFRKNIEFHFDNFSKNSEPITIKANKKVGIVIMSLQEYNSWMATNYELSSRTNEKRLDSAIRNMELGRTIIKEI